ncbi:MAG TPA: formylglycine-generating enzyme family protein [Planctomycetota bacterium]|nr:formylglycine-generating enzyme family protein [Planctomycetota bacterium]
MLPALLLALAPTCARQAPLYPDMPSGRVPPVEVKDASATNAAEMKPYEDVIVGTSARFAMQPVPPGTFFMGSAEDEKKRKPAEGPRHEVALDAFWIGRTEVTWDEYAPFQSKLDKEARKSGGVAAHEQDRWADAVSRPTPPYVPMDFGMGKERCPAISMTQFAARQYTQWLSMKTGRFYRLPTEAEWEYACRAGSTSTYAFGDDAAQLGEFAWSFENSGEKYHPVATKKPNAWGLFDMHGNVAEWVLDQYDDAFYASSEKTAHAPLAWPTKLYPCVVRGGSWDDDADRLRSAARRGSQASWQQQDPQLPKSIWYLTDAKFVGFRVVRPLVEPSEAEKLRYWSADTDAIREIQARQRAGQR